MLFNKVELIYKLITKREYKREKPLNSILLKKVISENIYKNKPLNFVMYWGKWYRNSFSDVESIVFERLYKYFSYITKYYTPWINLSIIYADSHAKLNWFDNYSIDSYKNSLKNFELKFWFKLFSMSELYKDIIDDNFILNEAFIEELVKKTKKHYLWEEDYYLVAKKYYLMNLKEKKNIEERFNDSIFLTYNWSDMNEILPTKLPIVYIYSLKRWISNKPWFI